MVALGKGLTGRPRGEAAFEETRLQERLEGDGVGGLERDWLGDEMLRAGGGRGRAWVVSRGGGRHTVGPTKGGRGGNMLAFCLVAMGMENGWEKRGERGGAAQYIDSKSYGGLERGRVQMLLGKESNAATAVRRSTVPAVGAGRTCGLANVASGTM